MMKERTEKEKEISVLLSHIKPLEIDLEHHREQAYQIELQLIEKRRKVNELSSSK